MVILTDLSGVLINGIEGTEKILAKKFGEEAGELFLKRHLATRAAFEDLMRGHMTEKEYWKLFFRNRSFPFNYKDIDEAFSDNLRKKVPDTLDMYQRIISHPYRIGKRGANLKWMPSIVLVSDHIRERAPYIRKYHRDIFEVVSLIYWSYSVGKIKRDPGFFRDILSGLTLRPDEVILIDDNQTNINTATLAGIPNILFESSDQTEYILKERYGFDFIPKVP